MAQALKDSIAAYVNQNPEGLNDLKKEIDELFSGHRTQPTQSEGLEKLMESLAITKSAKLSKYQKGDNFARFCERFKEYVQLAGMKPEQQYSYFLQSVDDQTYALLKSIELQPDQKMDVDAFCRAFTTAKYGDNSFTLKNEVWDCKQQVNQNIEEYVYQLREKANIAYSSRQEAEENCLLAFLRGVRSVDMKRKLNEAMITSFSQAVKLAKKIENVEKMLLNESNGALQVLVCNSDKEASSEESSSGNLRNRSPKPFHYKSRDNRRSNYKSDSRENRYSHRQRNKF